MSNTDQNKLAEELLDSERTKMAKLMRERRITIRQAVDAMMATRRLLFGTGEGTELLGTLTVSMNKPGKAKRGR